MSQATPEPGHGIFFPALEGLRAVAVVLVVLAHGLMPGLSGGFIGVDVFFVISGFLICRLLFREMADTGKIDLAFFWSRRIRRLLPNATLVLFATLIASSVLLPSFLWDLLAKDVRMAALQIANFHFADREVDYFRQDDPPSPILHFWSLAVEEQFYFIWPILLALIAAGFGSAGGRIARRLLPLIAVVSFAGMMLALSYSQPVAFFHSWARAWQLAIGGLLAIATLSANGFVARTLASVIVRSTLHFAGWFGLFIVLVCALTYDDNMVYPGAASLLPTLGTAALIGSVVLVPQVTWGVGACLALRPLRWLGARSYSWYLWHWPALILAEMSVPDVPGIRLAAALSALGPACLAFNLLENPIRRGRMALSAGATCLTGLVVVGVTVASASLFTMLPRPGGAEAANRQKQFTDASNDLGRNYTDKCHLATESSEQPPCIYGADAAPRRVVLIGDSHAAQWFSAIEKAAVDEGWGLRAWTKSSCPAMDIRIWHSGRKAAFHECDAWQEQIMRRLTGSERPDVVILSNLQDYASWIVDEKKPARPLQRREAEPLIRAGLETVVRRLDAAGVAVIIIRDTPRMIRSIGPCFVSGGGPGCDRSRDRAQSQPAADIDVARTMARVHLVDLTDRICEATVCRTTRDGQLIWRDSHHVRASFAAEQADAFRAALRKFATRP